MSYEELVLRMGVIIDQIKVMQGVLKHEPGKDEFEQCAIYLVKQGQDVMNEIIKRGKKP